MNNNSFKSKSCTFHTECSSGKCIQSSSYSQVHSFKIEVENSPCLNLAYYQYFFLAPTLFLFHSYGFSRLFYISLQSFLKFQCFENCLFKTPTTLSAQSQSSNAALPNTTLPWIYMCSHPHTHHYKCIAR